MPAFPIILFVFVVLFFLFTRLLSGLIVFSGTDPRLVMQIVVSIAVLGASLYIILSGKYTPQDQNWAYASAGTVIGYWLKG